MKENEIYSYKQNAKGMNKMRKEYMTEGIINNSWMGRLVNSAEVSLAKLTIIKPRKIEVKFIDENKDCKTTVKKKNNKSQY